MKKDKIGLSLGSGGAKGVVHIGALQAFQEEKIEFDMAGGTSIGSVIAGMYALNYTAREIFLLIKEFNLCKAGKLLELKVRGITLYKLLNSMLGERTFSDLKKPYFCIATNLYTGEEKVILEGDLCLAMAASCAIPPIFFPVKIDGETFVDGAFTNSVPANVLKNLGAKKVFSIDLSKELPNNLEQIKALKILYPSHNIKYSVRNKNAYAYSSYLFAPDLSKFSATKLSDINALFEIGYEHVKSNIKKIKSSLNIDK